MKINSVIGIILGILVFGGTSFLSFENVSVLLDIKSFLIVGGGTMTALVMIFSFKDIIHFLKIFFKRFISGRKDDMNRVVVEITNLSKEARKGRTYFERALGSVENQFLKEAGAVLFWADEEISDEELRDLLETKCDLHFERHLSDAGRLKLMGQYPPAFGLMGTTIGMIALLQGLSDDGGQNLGQSMAIALITTLYGLVFTNFFLSPIAESLQKQSQEENLIMRMIVEGIMLIHKGKPPRYVEEYVMSYIGEQK